MVKDPRLADGPLQQPEGAGRRAAHRRDLPLAVRLRRALWRRPLPEFEHEGARGEKTVARIRLVVIVGFAFLYLAQLAKDGADGQLWLSFTINGVWLIVAILLHAAAQSERWPQGLPILSSQIDVFGTTFIIWALLGLGKPQAAASALVLLPCYSLVVLTTILRQDQRACLAAGTASMVELTLIVMWEHRSELAGPWSGEVLARNVETASMIFLVSTTGIASLVLARVQGLQFEVLHDHLTGVYTRGYFEHRALLEEARARRLGHPMVLAMMDIDHFKRLNDRYGHDSGDLALREVGQLMRRAVRRTDIVARYGGEEFVLLFLDSDAKAVQGRLQGLRKAIADVSLKTAGTAQRFNLTVSVGWAAFPEHGASIDGVLRVADQLLLLAKERGRNRVVGARDASGGSRGNEGPPGGAAAPIPRAIVPRLAERRVRPEG